MFDHYKNCYRTRTSIQDAIDAELEGLEERARSDVSEGLTGQHEVSFKYKIVDDLYKARYIVSYNNSRAYFISITHIGKII